MEDPHLHCLRKSLSSLEPDVSDDCGSELVHLPNFLHLILAEFRRNLKISPGACGSLLVLNVSSLEACAQEVYHTRGIRRLGWRPIIYLALLPVDRSDVVAEQSSATEQTSKKSELGELADKVVHRLITVQFISKFMDGLQCDVDIPSLRRATFVASIQYGQRRHQLGKMTPTFCRRGPCSNLK